MDDPRHTETCFVAQRDRLFRLARWLVRSDSEAEDAIQDVYIKIKSSQSGPDDPTKIDAWLTQVVRNACLDRMRKPSLTQVDLENVHASKEPGPQQIAFGRDKLKSVLGFIRELPDPVPLVMQLRHVEGMTVKRIAEHLDTNANHIRVLICRARARLRELIDE